MTVVPTPDRDALGQGVDVVGCGRQIASSVATSRNRTPLRGDRCSTAAALARSPAACPPIPSATANIGDATTTLSSLLCRRCPTSLRAAQLSTTLPPPGIAMRWPTRSLPMWLTRSPPTARRHRRRQALGRQHLEHVAVAEVDQGSGRDDGGFAAQQRARLRSRHDHGRPVRRAHVGRDHGVAGLAQLEVRRRHLLVGGRHGDQPHPAIARDARHARLAAEVHGQIERDDDAVGHLEAVGAARLARSGDRDRVGDSESAMRGPGRARMLRRLRRLRRRLAGAPGRRRLDQRRRRRRTDAAGVLELVRHALYSAPGAGCSPGCDMMRRDPVRAALSKSAVRTRPELRIRLYSPSRD